MARAVVVLEVLDFFCFGHSSTMCPFCPQRRQRPLAICLSHSSGKSLPLGLSNFLYAASFFFKVSEVLGVFKELEELPLEVLESSLCLDFFFFDVDGVKSEVFFSLAALAGWWSSWLAQYAQSSASAMSMSSCNLVGGANPAVMNWVCN